MLDDELVEALNFVRREGPDGQMFEDVLLVRRGAAVPRAGILVGIRTTA